MLTRIQSIGVLGGRQTQPTVTFCFPIAISNQSISRSAWSRLFKTLTGNWWCTWRHTPPPCCPVLRSRRNSLYSSTAIAPSDISCVSHVSVIARIHAYRSTTEFFVFDPPIVLLNTTFRPGNSGLPRVYVQAF